MKPYNVFISAGSIWNDPYGIGEPSVIAEIRTMINQCGAEPFFYGTHSISEQDITDSIKALGKAHELWVLLTESSYKLLCYIWMETGVIRYRNSKEPDDIDILGIEIDLPKTGDHEQNYQKLPVILTHNTNWLNPNDKEALFVHLKDRVDRWKRQQVDDSVEQLFKKILRPSPVRNKIFISYSHHDKKLFDEFKKMMAPAINNGIVDLWDDTKIKPGAKWRKEIKEALATAKVAVLLVSDNFLASDFIAKQELPPLLTAAENEGVKVYWIYLSPCLYDQTKIATYQAAHAVSKPLSKLSKANRQAVFSEVCTKLISLTKEINGTNPIDSKNNKSKSNRPVDQ